MRLIYNGYVNNIIIHTETYGAWPWGVSRLLDGLEMVGDSSHFDMRHIGITGCSFAGKKVLFSGALDERIALTIAQKPGGGGAAAWRVSPNGYLWSEKKHRLRSAFCGR